MRNGVWHGGCGCVGGSAATAFWHAAAHMVVSTAGICVVGAGAGGRLGSFVDEALVWHQGFWENYGTSRRRDGSAGQRAVHSPSYFCFLYDHSGVKDRLWFVYINNSVEPVIDQSGELEGNDRNAYCRGA